MATYYVSPTGSDSEDGLSSVTAWETVAKVNGETFSADDIILFERGGTWTEKLVVPAASLTFGVFDGVAGQPATIDVGGLVNYCIHNIHDLCTFSDLVLTGATSHGFFADDAHSQTLTRVQSNDNAGNGFTLNGDAIVMTDCHASGNTLIGISQAGGYDDLELTECTANTNDGGGIKLDASVDPILTDCQANSNGTGVADGHGLHILAGSGAQIATRFVADTNNGNGVLLEDTSGVVTEGVVARSNVEAATVAYGVVIDNSNSCEFHRALIVSNETGGVSIIAGSASNDLVYSVVSGSPKGVVLGSAHGINNQINHCLVHNCATAGISLENAGAGAATIVKSTIILGNGTGVNASATEAAAVHDLDYNLYYGNTTAVEWDEDTYLDSAIDTFFGDHALEANGIGGTDPMVSDPPNNMHLIRPSPAMWTGIPAGVGPNLDFYGQTPHDPPSIGPAENTGQPHWMPAYGGRRI